MQYLSGIIFHGIIWTWVWLAHFTISSNIRSSSLQYYLLGNIFRRINLVWMAHFSGIVYCNIYLGTCSYREQFTAKVQTSGKSFKFILCIGILEKSQNFHSVFDIEHIFKKGLFLTFHTKYLKYMLYSKRTLYLYLKKYVYI